MCGACLDLGTIHEQRRRASERAAKFSAKIQMRLDAQMRKNWELVLGTILDSKEEVGATVTRLLQESQKIKQIKKKEDKAISNLSKQIKITLRGLWQKRVPGSGESKGS